MGDNPTSAELISQKYLVDGASVVETYQNLGFQKHVALMKKHMNLYPGSRVLDIGCGTAALLLELCQAEAEVTGLDSFEEAGGIDRKIADARLKETNLNANLVTGTALAMPFDDDVFDLSVSIGMLEHISPSIRPNMMKEMFRVVKPGGFLFLIAGPTNLTPFDQHIPGHPFPNWLSRERKSKVSDKEGRRQFLEVPWGISRSEIYEALPEADIINLYGAYFAEGGGQTGGDFSWELFPMLVWMKRKFKLHRLFGAAASVLYLLHQEHCHILAVQKPAKD